MDLMDAFTCN